MQQKLKAVFRRSSKSRGSSGSHDQLDSSSHHGVASPSRTDQPRVSSERRGRTSVDSSVTRSGYTDCSRPVSSVYDDSRQGQAPPRQTAASESAYPADSNGSAIASDYKAYIPALSPVDDSHGDDYTTPGGDRQQITRDNEAKHEEHVADRNIARYSTSIDGGHRATTGGMLNKSAVSSPTENNLSSNERLHKIPQETHGIAGPQSGVRHATLDGTADGEETALARRLRKGGVADLRNTIDTDGDITWAPAVTHEVIKPHEHEIVQQKIFREIHNYEHFHRIQPVMMTEVLPPRHWIPNPNGEGLIEISADELPARTGDNRWWSICEHSSPYSQQMALPKYRTEPEIIDAGTTMTEQGFERRETIIIHPPTLADLTGYGGPVQAMHFDHKTGKSWMGELTTMEKLQVLQQELDRAPDAYAFNMETLDKALPELPLDSARRSSAAMPVRKPVSGHPSTVSGSNVGRQLNFA